MAVRCSATSSRSGQPCRAWAINGGTVCVSHGGAAPQVQRKAAERLKEARDKSLARYVAFVDRGEVDARTVLSGTVQLTELVETLEGRVARREGVDVDAAAGARDILALHLARLAERRGPDAGTGESDE